MPQGIFFGCNSYIVYVATQNGIDSVIANAIVETTLLHRTMRSVVWTSSVVLSNRSLSYTFNYL